MEKTIYYKDNTLSFTAGSSAENTVFCRRIRGVRVPYYFYLLAEAENSSNFLEMTSQLGIMRNGFARKRSFPLLRIT
jgi:hypothetical protein